DQGTPRAIGRITPNGTTTEFSSGLNAGSLPNGIMPGADGNAWFADRGTIKAIGRITPGGAITEFSTGLAAGSSPRGVAAGAYGFDGYRWLLDGSAIAGASGRSYTPTIADIGHQLSCSVTATYTLLGTTVSATSATVTVRDLTAPVLSLPGTVVAEASGPAG